MARLSTIRIALALMGVGVLAACAPSMLSRNDRKDACQVAVLETPALESPNFQPNPLADAAGGMAAGAGGGAALAIFSSLAFPPAWLLTAPVGAVIGAGYAAQCVAAGQSHPTAEADFEELFLATYPGRLKQALERDLNAPREGCPIARVGAVPAVAPDTVIEIQEVKFQMGCALGKQQYVVEVKWQAMSATDKRLLGEAGTRCHQTSFWDVDDWFADPERARAEIEGVLNTVGKRIAGQLLSEGQSRVCELQSNKNGEIEAKR